ncbi:MAG TPA: MFS transporter [Microbacteriaceae bacterium]|nr:MFS transporter [Microbacteriaceae bacterium]
MTSAPLARPSITAWRNATFTVFGVAGIAIATLLSRMPALRDHLDVDPGQIGLMLAFFSGGSVLGLAFSGTLLHTIGARRIIQLGMPTTAVTLGGIGVTGEILESYAATAAVAALFGAAVAVTDVATNVEGAAIERETKRTVMTTLHAGFSLGTVVGAILGALAAQLEASIVVHLGIIAVVILVIAFTLPRWIPAVVADEGPKPTMAERRAVWTQPKTILLGLVVFAFAYIEGAANDWLTLGLHDERGFSEAGAALMLGVFTAAMTVGRLVAAPVIDRFGRVSVLIVSALLAAAGLSLLIFIPETWAVIVGTIVWALGSCLGFPLGLSAAGDDPATASSRVAAVSLIGYVAFFAGPPLVGFIADSTGILPALTIIFAFIAIAIAASPAARPTVPRARAATDVFDDPAIR